jgi:MFS family permease
VMKGRSDLSLGSAFDRIWVASITTNLADGLLKVAAPLLAVTLTDSPFLISLLSALVMLPWLFFAIPIGGLVDRVDRRLALAGANATRFLITAIVALLIATDAMSIYWLYVATFIIGICEVLVDTTSQSLIPQVVEEKNLDRANSRLQVSETVIQEFVGAPMSGLLYSIAIVIPFIANSAGFVIATILVLLVPPQLVKDLKESSGRNQSTFKKDLSIGLKFMFAHQRIRKIVFITTSIGFFASLSSATAVLFVLKVLEVPTRSFGLVMAIQGAGGVLGGLLAPKLSSRWGRGPVMAISITTTCLSMIATGFAPNVYLFIVFGFAIAFFITNWNILLMASYQTMIPNELFGRVHGARRTFVWGLMPIGALVGGWIATIDLRLPFVVGGLGATLICLASFRFIYSLDTAQVEAA